MHPITALQEAWSLSQRDVERELLPTAAELDITVVAHSPTGHGVLHHPAAQSVLGTVAAGIALSDEQLRRLDVVS